MENIEMDANAAINLVNANHDEKVRQEKDSEAMNLGNSNYENLAAKIKEESMNKAEIEATRRQKKYSRRAFLIGALTGMGGLAASLALYGKTKSDIDKSNTIIKKEQMIDEAYDSVKEELYKKLLVQTPSEFKFELSDTTLNGYSDYLIYRLAKEHEMTNAGDYKYYAECTNAVNLFKQQVFKDRENNSAKYEGIIVPDNNYLNVPDSMIYRYINGEDFSEQTEQYLEQKSIQSKGATR